MEVRYAVEGPTDEAVAIRLIQAVGLQPVATLIARGKHNLDPKLPGYNKAAGRSMWLVLRDLDRDDAQTCVPGLVQSLLGGSPSRGMCFRVVVRAVEAWMLADYRGCARYFAVNAENVPRAVESLTDPKQSLINMCRRSGKREIREGIVPRPGSRRNIGENYTTKLREFAGSVWDPERARHEASDLDRALRSLEKIRGLLR